MPARVTCQYAKQNLATLWDEVVATRCAIVIERPDAEDVAMLPASELSSLLETVHLMRSAENARRLADALLRAGRADLPPQTVPELRASLGLAERADRTE